VPRSQSTAAVRLLAAIDPGCTEIARELRSLAAGGLRPVYGAGIAGEDPSR
jgi:hypothetical protein